jgi:hypothetical protein
MLILDVLKYIATHTEDVWYKLTLIDEDFKKYAYSSVGISAFINAFYKCEIRDGFMNREIFGHKHSFDDLPAYESTIIFNAMNVWYYNGEIHRGHDKPAITMFNNYKVWYKYGKTHRDNNLSCGCLSCEGCATKPYYTTKPAVKWNLTNNEYNNFIKIWEGARHRAIRDSVSITDYRIWYKDGLLHREDGPAFIDNVGVGRYYINGVEQIGIQV